MYSVRATNKRGGFFLATIKDPKEADAKHKALWHERDSEGNLKWGMVSTTKITEPWAMKEAV
tara:strand:- start:4744 stop:4929 length:186 start_codon:yes stop_codon:yes gene_type:complete